MASPGTSWHDATEPRPGHHHFYRAALCKPKTCAQHQRGAIQLRTAQPSARTAPGLPSQRHVRRRTREPDRISKISEPEYVCYADTDYTPYSYVEYIVESGGVPQIGMGMEDQFDESWYCYYFEYQPGSEGELPEFFRYDLTAEDVDACRAGLEPPFVCPAPCPVDLHRERSRLEYPKLYSALEEVFSSKICGKARRAKQQSSN
jgi:hypothetical protein